MPILKDSSHSLNLLTEGIFDDFHRANGAVGNNWIDAHDYYPNLFDKAVILDNYLDTTGVSTSTWGSDTPGYYPWWLVGHTLIAQPNPWKNFQVTVRFSTEDPLAVLSQISPALFVDIDSPSILTLGVKPVTDISLNFATYWQNVFRTNVDMGDVMDPPTYYRMVAGTAKPGPTLGPTGTGTYQEIMVRVVDGQMLFWWNGVKRTDSPVAVPDYVKDGRPNMVGIDVISIHSVPGHEWGTSGVTPDHTVRDQIMYFACQPYNGSL